MWRVRSIDNESKEKNVVTWRLMTITEIVLISIDRNNFWQNLSVVVDSGCNGTMTRSVQTKDFLCFAKCTDKECTPAIANLGCWCRYEIDRASVEDENVYVYEHTWFHLQNSFLLQACLKMITYSWSNVFVRSDIEQVVEIKNCMMQ
jgi:hypothetical protein